MVVSEIITTFVMSKQRDSMEQTITYKDLKTPREKALWNFLTSFKEYLKEKYPETVTDRTVVQMVAQEALRKLTAENFMDDVVEKYKKRLADPWHKFPNAEKDFIEAFELGYIDYSHRVEPAKIGILPLHDGTAIVKYACPDEDGVVINTYKTDGPVAELRMLEDVKKILTDYPIYDGDGIDEFAADMFIGGATGHFIQVSSKRYTF